MMTICDIIVTYLWYILCSICSSIRETPRSVGFTNSHAGMYPVNKKRIYFQSRRSIETRRSRGTPRENTTLAAGTAPSKERRSAIRDYDRGCLTLWRKGKSLRCDERFVTLLRAILLRPRSDERASLSLTQRTAWSEDVYSRYESFRSTARSLVRACTTAHSWVFFTMILLR